MLLGIVTRSAPFSLQQTRVLLGVLCFFGLLPSRVYGAIYDVYTTSNGTTQAADQQSIATTFYRKPTESATSVTAIYANKDITWGSAGLSTGSTGSGVYTDLFRIQANNTEQGYNSTTLRYDQKNGVGIPVLQIKNASIVNYNSVRYFEFLFDGNENDNAVSLDEFLVFTSPVSISTATSQANPTQAQVISFFENSTNRATLRYSLDSLDSSGNVTTDNSVLFYASGGSGHGDEGIYFPTSTFEGTGGAYIDDYIYIWTKMGGVGTLNSINFASSGGFEEFAYFRGDQGGTVYGSVVPEMGPVMSAGLLLFVALFRRKRPSLSL